MGRWGYNGYREYETVAEKKARAAKSIERLKKKNLNLAPIQVIGRKIAKTWWGMAWNDNLENYADFSNRIGRGRAYLTQGAVLDLQIAPGKITGLVQGSRAKPYEVAVAIAPLGPKVWEAVTKGCAGSIHSLSELLEGKFPKQLAELFTIKGKGLFPSPREIGFSCSCPDWAGLCKHVAAILYGVGTRLDEDPSLFFKLRQVDISELISQSVEQTTDALLKKAGRKSKRALASDDLSGLFGVAIDGEIGVEIGGSIGETIDVSAPFHQRAAKPRATVVPAASPATAVLAGENTAEIKKKRGRPRKTE